MGRAFASELASGEFGSLEQSLHIHLTSNHYPPVPTSMVPVCIAAINSYNANFNGDELVELPEGVSWRGNTSAPAWAIIDGHHLHEWCDSEDDYCEDYE